MGSHRTGGKRAPTAASRPAEIGGRLRAARATKGWTREALAFHSGVSWAAIAQIESGRRTDVRLKTLDALASALGLSVDHLLGRDHDAGSLEHRAMFYRSSDEFLRATIPFLREGLEQAHGLIAVTSRTNTKALREELGPAAKEVTFFASDSWYREPHATLQAFRDSVDERIEAGHGWVRIIGEPVWAGRSPDDLRRWIRYEALINLALATSRATIVCPYDAASLPAPIVTSARRTHPELHPDGRPNGRYREPAELLLQSDVGFA